MSESEKIEINFTVSFQDTELLQTLNRIADAFDQLVRLEMPHWKGKDKDKDTGLSTKLVESGRILAGDKVTDRAIDFLEENK